MKNHVEQASASNMVDDESSSPNKGKEGIDVVGGDSDIHESSSSSTEITSSISNPELKIVTSKILAQLSEAMEAMSSLRNRDYCCIYKVPESLRNVNWKAYTPQLISIGPFHFESKRDPVVQAIKWRFFADFTKQDKKKIRNLVNIIQNNEKYIRRCYSEKFERIDSCDFIKMILLDAVFIIEFLKGYKHPKNFEPRMLFVQDDLFVLEPRMMFDMKEDLILLENQLPFSIIWDIYSEKNCDDATWNSFLDLVSNAFGKNKAGPFLDRVPNSPTTQPQSVNGSKHFTALARQFMLKGSIKGSIERHSFDHVKLKYSAVMLRKAGVRFQVTRDSCLVNITFDKGVLKIPQLEVDHNFERRIRNIMAMEQCLYMGEAYICSYIKFMDHLIDSAEDVGLLVENGIIVHWLGHHAAVSNIINHFCEMLGDSYTCFDDISQELNAHYESRFNRTKASLILVYFPNIWRGTATIAAALLLILTFIQTLSSLKLFG